VAVETEVPTRGKHYRISTLRRPQDQPTRAFDSSVFSVLGLESGTAFAHPVAHGHVTSWFVTLVHNMKLRMIE
jgi:hypothetical protein